MTDENFPENMEGSAGAVGYGYHNVPFSMENEHFKVYIHKHENGYRYRRETGEGNAEKIVAGRSGKAVVIPVEPVNKPREITPFFLIDLAETLAVEPRRTVKIMVTFPVEIAIGFVPKNNNIYYLDVLSINKPKYTLYGNPKNGLICRYWRSDVYFSMPPVNPFSEGVMTMTITNSSKQWVNVNHAVFSAFNMTIYYKINLVGANATMKILGENTAETAFVDSPLEKDMKKSLHFYEAKRLPVLGGKLIMEEGF